MIIKTLVVGPFDTNCYVVGAEATKSGMIIDPGAEAKDILKMVKDAKIDIKLIVLTHGHIDHVGALKEVKEATGAPVAMHKAESEALRGQYRSLGEQFGLDYPAPPAPDRLLEEGDSLDTDGLHFAVLHTPGHTPGGICLLGEGVVFTGDTLFQFSIGRTDFPGGSYDQLMQAIHNKLMPLPDGTIVYPGHGPKTTIGAERMSNPFLR
ncbi:MAG: MBL fold metallo-hydrolase [Chloroflexota bacterium]|nr:MBL fold metallo-hydrolase [Chloroflexota bacterium]